jgi:hypothetical protein
MAPKASSCVQSNDSRHYSMCKGFESLKKMTFDIHVKCLSCMMGKATLEDFMKSKRPINKPFYQVYMDSFSSSVKPIEGYNHAIVFVDTAT